MSISLKDAAKEVGKEVLIGAVSAEIITRSLDAALKAPHPAEPSLAVLGALGGLTFVGLKDVYSPQGFFSNTLQGMKHMFKNMFKRTGREVVLHITTNKNIEQKPRWFFSKTNDAVAIQTESTRYGILSTRTSKIEGAPLIIPDAFYSSITIESMACLYGFAVKRPGGKQDDWVTTSPIKAIEMSNGDVITSVRLDPSRFPAVLRGMRTPAPTG